MPAEDCLPQSVAVDRARMYVADPYNCKIHLYEMGNYLGDFILNTFNVPRYVLCVPSSPQIIPGKCPCETKIKSRKEKIIFLLFTPLTSL